MRFTKAICDPARSEVHIRDVPRIEIEVLLALIQGKIAAPPALLIPIRSITAGRPDVGSFAHGRAFRCVCPPDAVLRFSELGLQQKRQLHRAPCNQRVVHRRPSDGRARAHRIPDFWGSLCRYRAHTLYSITPYPAGRLGKRRAYVAKSRRRKDPWKRTEGEREGRGVTRVGLVKMTV